MTEQEYINNVKKVSQSRVHKASNSNTIRAIYWAFRRAYKGEMYNISEKTFGTIIRALNEEIGNTLITNGFFTLPYKLGCLEFSKFEPKIKLINHKVQTHKPIDWNETLKLWYQDEESRDRKQLVRTENQFVYRVTYNKLHAYYSNKWFIEFETNRTFRNKIRDLARQGKLEAYLKRNGNTIH